MDDTMLRTFDYDISNTRLLWILRNGRWAPLIPDYGIRSNVTLDSHEVEISMTTDGNTHPNVSFKFTSLTKSRCMFVVDITFESMPSMIRNYGYGFATTEKAKKSLTFSAGCHLKRDNEFTFVVPNAVPSEQIQRLFVAQQNDLKMIFQFHVMLEGQDKNSVASASSPVIRPPSTVSSTSWSKLEQIATLYRNKSLIDVHFLVEGQLIGAHKLLLSAVSPVFRQILASNFREGRESVIEIVDFDAATVKVALDFLYTEIYDQRMEAESVVLLKFADKYDIELMKAACEAHLAATVDDSNFVELFIYATDYNAAKLRDRCTNAMTQLMTNVKSDKDLNSSLY